MIAAPAEGLEIGMSRSRLLALVEPGSGLGFVVGLSAAAMAVERQHLP